LSIGDKLLKFIEKSQKRWLFPVTFVIAGPCEAYPLGAGMPNNLKRKLGLSLESDIDRHYGSAATITVVGRLFQKIEQSVDQSCGCLFAQRCKYGT
jgi:hypothetical protein